MPDHPAPFGSAAPPDWHHAFAALPLETPPADGWQRIASALPRTPRRRRHLLPWAVAAATACLAALPALQLLRAPMPVEATLPAPAGPAQVAPGTENADVSTVAQTGERDSVAAAVPVTGRVEPAPIADVPQPGLAPLQAESARLEGLLAELSAADTGDGMQLALGASLRTQVAGIDDALAGTDLDAAARSGLWQQRVELLRALAGLAAEQRWQALYGRDGPDYALVQVH
jgi:hypothetical protein